LAALGTAQLVDRLPEMKDQALSVLSAIATEKAELLPVERQAGSRSSRRLPLMSGQTLLMVW
jgi:hypothetical protein